MFYCVINFNRLQQMITFIFIKICYNNSVKKTTKKQEVKHCLNKKVFGNNLKHEKLSQKLKIFKCS